MDGDEAIGAARRLLRRRPGEVLPPFVAEAGVQAVLQAVGGAVALTVLLTSRGTGRVDRVVAAGENLLDASTRAEVAAGETALREAVVALFTPTVVAVALVGVAVVVVARGAVGAAKVHVARATLRSEPRAGVGRETDRDGHVETVSDGGRGPLATAVEGAFADTWRFAGITALRGAVLVGPALAGLAATGWTLTPVVALLGLAGLLAAYFGFLFVGDAVVVDDVGPLGAIQRSAAFVRRRPGRAALYVAVEVATYVALFVVVQVLAVLGVGRGVDLLTLFLVFPFLGLVRMGLYLPERQAGPRAGPSTPTGAAARTAADSEGETEHETGTPDPDPDLATGAGRGLVDDLLRVVREGVAELRRFVAGNVGLVVVAFGLFLAGGVAGRVVGPDAARSIAGDPSETFGAIPVDVAVEIALNNWQVGIAEGYGGIGLGVPTAAALLFNGVVVGVTSGLFEPVAFAALIVPHAVIEVPALAVGGALGLHLGRETLRTARGEASAAHLGGELRRALSVLVGLLPVFVVAGVVEAFLTPAIAGLVLG